MIRKILRRVYLVLEHPNLAGPRLTMGTPPRHFPPLVLRPLPFLFLPLRLHLALMTTHRTTLDEIRLLVTNTPPVSFRV